MDLSVIFLGTGGSVPTAQRAPLSMLLRRGGDNMLFDCGEGTQRQMLRSVGLEPVQEIFLSHYHAEHYLGLPGLLKTYDLQGRQTPLTVYGPPGLVDLFKSLRRIFGKLQYRLELVELQPGQVLQRAEHAIAPFPTEHTMASFGYVLFEQQRPGRFDPKKAQSLGVKPGPDFGRLQRGEEVEAGSKTVRPTDVMGEARAGRKVTITGDTEPCEATAMAAHGSQLLVHDATFSEEEADRARKTGHSTATSAAQLAKEAEVEMLALTHLSTRYFGRELRKEAQMAFKNTVVPNDFDEIVIPFPEKGKVELSGQVHKYSRDSSSENQVGQGRREP